MSLPFNIDNLRKTALRLLEEKFIKNNIKFRAINGHRRIHYKIIKNTKEYNLSVFSGDGECLKIFKYHEDLRPYFIYIWYVYENPTFYILDFKDVKRLFGPKPFETFSWKQGGYYSWSSATGVPIQRKNILNSYHKDNWTILK